MYFVDMIEVKEAFFCKCIIHLTSLRLISALTLQLGFILWKGESLKYELWHFVGGAILAQNLRFSNHCHFAQRSALIIHKVFALLSFSRGVSLASVLGWQQA